MTNLDSVLKNRDITLLTKVCVVKAMVFPVVMYTFESWTVKKAEGQKIDALNLWFWRRLLKVPWAAKQSSQSTLREISPEFLFEGVMLKLKLQYFGHLIETADSLEKSLMLGKIEGRRRKGHQRMRWLDASPVQWTWTWANSGRWWGTGELACCSQWGCKVLDMTRWLNNYSSLDMSISVSEFIPTLLPLLVSICFSSLSLKWSEKNSQDNKALDHIQGHLLQRKRGVEYS